MPKTKPGPKLPTSTNSSGASNVALVITVFNEAGNISQLVSGIAAQVLLPREAVIVDGGSTDGTYSLLQKLAREYKWLKVFQIPGNRSVGRNYGVSRTSAPIIAFTDAGCYPDAKWLANIIKPFVDKNVQVVSGYYRGDARNIFQKCLIPYVLVMPDKAAKTEFFPSTRSMAIRRTAWNKSGGFDIHLSHNEDYAFAHWLKKLGFNFVFAPDAIVNWQPRKDLASSFWMFLRFALGDIQSGIIRPQVKRLFIRTLAFLFFISLSIEVPILLIPTIFVVLLYLLWSAAKNYRYVNDLRALYWLPILQLTADAAVLMGSVIGILSRK